MPSKSTRFIHVLLFALNCLAASGTVQAATETILHTFGYFPNGITPCGTMIFDAAGNLYGTTYQGGAANMGVVFEREASGTFQVLHNFQGGADGSGPFAGVVLDTAGNLYGTTYEGGTANQGVVYKITSSGQETVLYTFTGGADGGSPFAGLTLDAAGNLYGTAYAGGSANLGVVYKLSLAGQQTVLFNFPGGAGGGHPYSGVVSDPAGNLYGTTSTGGASGGVVYRLSPSGQETILYSGIGPATGGLILDSAGNLYGADSQAVYTITAAGQYKQIALLNQGIVGGPPTSSLARDAAGNLYGVTVGEYKPTESPSGAVFKVDTSGQLTLLLKFAGYAGGAPVSPFNPGVVLDAAGNIYGDSGGFRYGALYKITAAGAESILYRFPPAPGGSDLYGGVIRDARGNLYGTTGSGGPGNLGVLYELSSKGETVLLSGLSELGRNVTRDSEGNLYITGADSVTGLGRIYKVSPSGSSTLLYSFTGGADGIGTTAVYLDAQGNLYGTASGGGSPNGCVYKLTPSGVFSVLFQFNGGTDGFDPTYELTLDPAGNIYGTTHYGGAGAGVVYRISPTGVQTVLHTFSGSDGDSPAAGVTLDPEGNLYGTTLGGGSENGGVIYMLAKSGTFAVLYNFLQHEGGLSPLAGVAIDSEGNVYGTASSGGDMTCDPFGPVPTPSGCGVVYELSGGVYTVLHTFQGGTDGAYPSAGPILDLAGNLYGTTTFGGIAGAGVVFKTAGL